MRKFIVIPDSFKGTISSIEVCQIIESSILEIISDAQIKTIPIADGGEGTVDAYLHALKGQKIEVETTGPFGRNLTAYYGLFDQVAVFEIANVAGLTMCDHLDPTQTTTYGLGALIKDAIKRGAKKLLIGLGGSATNDAGIGLALSLGVQFYDSKGRLFKPNALSLSQIKNMDTSQLDELLRGIEVIGICDVKNPLYGTEGAAYIYGPQKGADALTVQLLDQELQSFGDFMQRDFNIDFQKVEGAGAAGGLGAGIVSFLKATLNSGIETLLDTIGFDDIITDTDLIITGEGRMDHQSLQGKVIYGIASRAKKKLIPVIAVCGAYDVAFKDLDDLNIISVFSTNPEAIDFSISKNHAKANLEKTIKHLMRYTQHIIKSKI